MSIQTQIDRLSANVTAALDAIASKGITVPAGSNSDNLASLIMEIGSSNIVILNGAPNEVISFTGANSGSVTLNSSGVGAASVNSGIYIFTGSISGYQKSVTVSGDTTVNVWPDGTIVYWYGREFYKPKAVAYAPKSASIGGAWITSNRKALTIAKDTNSVTFTQPAIRGYYCGSAIFEDVTTNGGTLALLSRGKLANSGDPQVFFSYAADISSGTFTPAGGDSVDYGETNVAISGVAAGTYDIAISAMNAALNYSGSVEVYAVYFAE